MQVKFGSSESARFTLPEEPRYLNREIASVIADRGRHFGPSSDPFFSGALQEAALDFIDIVNGVKTVNQAIADVEQYAPAHHASTDAGLILLEDLLKNIKAGKYTPTQLAVHLFEGDIKVGMTHHYFAAGLSFPDHVALLNYALHVVMREWGSVIRKWRL